MKNLKRTCRPSVCVFLKLVCDKSIRKGGKYIYLWGFVTYLLFCDVFDAPLFCFLLLLLYLYRNKCLALSLSPWRYITERKTNKLLQVERDNNNK